MKLERERRAGAEAKALELTERAMELDRRAAELHSEARDLRHRARMLMVEASGQGALPLP